MIDVASPRLSDFTGTVDAVIDTVGGATQGYLIPLVKPGGIIISSVSTTESSAVRGAPRPIGDASCMH